jgi:succinate-acetate transporter protein
VPDAPPGCRHAALSSQGRNQLTVNDDRSIMMAPAADPAPLGLAAFALTTFLLSAANAH